MQKCPKCGSKNTEIYFYSGAKALKCNSCGYDEGEEFEQHTTEKTSQKAKGQYSPYKRGGPGRANK